MQIKEAIILAGGLGTRLRSAVPELPKCMAPVNGKPFIAYVIEYLQQQPGINYAVDVAKIGEAPIPEPLKTMIINGYNFIQI